jgi:Nitrate reductase gamma subunit
MRSREQRCETGRVDVVLVAIEVGSQPHQQGGGCDQAHSVAAFLLFALWPFTRLVHVLSAPVGYLWRPYIVYRSKDERLGAQAARRGWEPV